MKLKKIIGVALATALCMFSTVPVFAAGLSAEEQAILDKLKAGVEVDGTVISVPAELIAQAENELMKNDADITAEEAGVITTNMDEVIAIAQENNIKSAEELKASADLVLPLVQEAADVVGYTVSFDAADQNFTVVDPDGNTVFTSKDAINQTGFDLSTTVVVGGVMITLLAACLVVANKKKLFAKAVEA